MEGVSCGEAFVAGVTCVASSFVRPRRGFTPAPDPLFFASPRKRGESSGDPTALALLGLRPRRVPCAARSPAPARTRCARLRLAPLRQAGRVRRVACLRHAGRLAVLLGGADGRGTANSQYQQPTAGPRLADGYGGIRYSAVGVHSPSAPPRSAAKGAVRQRRTSSSGSRSLFERREPKASAASSARGPLGEHRREPLPAAGREGRAQCGVAFLFPPFLWRSKEKGVGSRAEGPGRGPGAKRPGMPNGPGAKRPGAPQRQ